MGFNWASVIQVSGVFMWTLSRHLPTVSLGFLFTVHSQSPYQRATSKGGGCRLVSPWFTRYRQWRRSRLRKSQQWCFFVGRRGRFVKKTAVGGLAQTDRVGPVQTEQEIWQEQWGREGWVGGEGGWTRPCRNVGHGNHIRGSNLAVTAPRERMTLPGWHGDNWTFSSNY